MSNAAEPRARWRRGGRPIASPIFALVLVSVLVAAAINFAITFSGPPPKQPPRGIESIAALIRTGEQPGDPGPQLSFGVSRALPTPPPHTRADPDAAAKLARRLGVPPGEVVAYLDGDDRRFEDAFLGRFLFGWRTPEGWRVVENPRPPTFLRWHWITLLSMLAAIVALAIPAWAIAQAIARPLRQLAAAAARVRPGAALALPTGGSREVRALADAVGQMHARLAGHAQGRTTMLAAIAHDLGTPLSRLAFRAEQLPEAARARAMADIDEMRGMIAAALRFARDELADGPAQRLDLGSLLQALADDMADTGAPVSIDPGSRAVVRGDAIALRRLFQNLVENAVRYGDRAAIGWSVDDGEVAVTIDDEGPGIDPARVEQLFEPFVRGDPSRNRATGGTGLGLAIVRSIAAQHGGEATLEPRAGGGTRARVVLPLSG